MTGPAATGRGAPPGHSLAEGAAGIALLHIERTGTGECDWTVAHSWLAAATAEPVAATTSAGLFLGAPAIAFALHTAANHQPGRYLRAISAVDRAVTDLTHRRVDAALARIDRGEPARFAEYDVINGLTGIGAHLLHHSPHSHALPRILGYLVRLTEPRLVDGDVLPGWWVEHDPQRRPDTRGHANLGMAHGIAGPLALLALAHRAGLTVDRHDEAIHTITTWYQTWQREHPHGPWWPQWITREQLRTGRPDQRGPGRPSWCYGTPGIARALQLAATATANPALQRIAEQALTGCLTNPQQLKRITNPGLCHGAAGLHQTAWRAATDAADPGLANLLPTRLLTDRGSHAALGFLDGAAGTALARLTAVHDQPPASGWDTCLLIA